MKRHLSTIIAAALLLALALAGCQGGTSKEESPTFSVPPTPAVDPHEGEVEVLVGGGGTMWVPEAEKIPPFGHAATDFNVVDQTPIYAGEGLTMRRGIDVSDHQKKIDWQAVADYGIDFAIIRCGWRSYGEGTVNEDSRFRENIEGALDAGLEVGVYFFSQAINIVEAAEEAVFTLHLIEDYDVTLPVFFDWEEIGVAPARTDDLDGETLTDCCLEFAELVRAAGYQPGMYCYLNLAYFTYQLDRMEDIAFWMGDPGTMPIFYYDHDFWQYSFTATVPGIEVDVDMDAVYIRDGETWPPVRPTEEPAEEPAEEPTEAPPDGSAEEEPSEEEPAEEEPAPVEDADTEESGDGAG